jgi:carboxyl-terminal processing protease
MRIAVYVLLVITDLLLTVTTPSADEPVAKHRSDLASYQDIQMFANTLTILQRLSGENRERKKYLYAALQSMTEALDRYSYFVPPDMIGLFHEVHKNKYVGIGLHIARSSDGKNIEIVSVENDSPAQRASLEPGEIITAIDGKPVREMRLLDAVKIMMSPGLSEGSKTTISVLKTGYKNPIDVSLTRAIIKPAVISWNIPEKKYGYIKVSYFNKSTVTDFHKAIEDIEARDEKLKGVIIDLRSNPGGEIEASVQLARLFVNEGVIASLANRLDDVNTVYKANNTRLYDWPIVVVVDKGTASAAELFAGALQIHKRASLVGQKTFGKGVYQSLVPLSSDAGLYITIGPYYLPDGGSIDGVGLTPDVLLPWGTSERVIIRKTLDILKSKS